LQDCNRLGNIRGGKKEEREKSTPEVISMEGGRDDQDLISKEKRGKGKEEERRMNLHSDRKERGRGRGRTVTLIYRGRNGVYNRWPELGRTKT